jgi:hypothetical protein
LRKGTGRRQKSPDGDHGCGLLSSHGYLYQFWC